MHKNNLESTKKSSVVLKAGKEKAIKNRHHWIFSGAVKHLPDFEKGAILPVFSADGELLGSAYFNKKTSITGRMLTFDSVSPLQAIENNIQEAITFRQELFDRNSTNAYRLINGEGDMLPGLIVDVYNNVLVLQIATLGMERLKSTIVELLLKKTSSHCIYEKSEMPSRYEEGLKDCKGMLFGSLPDRLIITENNLQFIVDIEHGQKTGFFLDQRENRKLVHSLSNNKRVLNCFSYTGGFTVYAAHGGATLVDSVDSSEQALEFAKSNCSLNHLKTNLNFYADDVFSFLRTNDLAYDFVILDPPAFAKKKDDVIKACRGYKDINRLVLQKIPHRSFLLTCSCSYYVDEQLFQKVVFQAALEAGRTVRIIQKHHLAFDHPINIYHPEGNYLKSLLLYIE
ncbi:MAG: class I SAM-dependent rRNA methyltransferase [Patescibacteria group bacterium]|nr:class I SAM-dependent rRNA methyltransferase [Patescibacteria group bacterium]